MWCSWFIALFACINNSISASIDSAVGSASIWQHIAIEGTIIALLTNFNVPITTLFDSSGVNWWSSSTSGRGNKGISAEEALGSSVVLENHAGESSKLSGSECPESWYNKPVDILSAGGSCLRSLIGVSADHGIGVASQMLEVDSGVCQSLATNVEGTEWRTTVDGSERI